MSGELGIEGREIKLWMDIQTNSPLETSPPENGLLGERSTSSEFSSQRPGLNFAIILNDLISMGYEVEWRVINAADYGMPQQRSRVFILAYRTPRNKQKSP